MRLPHPLFAAFLAISCSGGVSTGVTRSATKEPAGPEVLAWVVPYADSLASLERNASWITMASPTYFRLAVSGKAVRLEDWDPAVPFPRERLESLRAGRAFEVLPMVGCIGPCGPKISRVLDDDGARDAHIADLLRVAREQSLRGLVIDYEDIDAREASVTRFVTDLSSGLHAAGKKLVLVVQEPCGIDPACRRDPYPFALGTLIDKVDRLAVMEYDLAVDGSSPPAPRDWVSRGLAKVVSEVGEGKGRRKVLCALPLYGRLTAGIADDTAVLFSEVQPGRVRNVEARMGKVTFDPSLLSKSVPVTSGAKTGTLYLEDHETLAARLALVSSFGLGGVGLWRLGGEDPCIGTELARYRRMKAPPCT
jgi:spore germination protein YaaH